MPYVNGDPSRGIQGSIPPAEVFEFPQRELIDVIRYSNLVPTNSDLRQLTRGIRSQHLNFARDTGSVNELSIALDPPLTNYTPGLPLRVRVAHQNDGQASIAVNDLPRRWIIRPNGFPLSGGEMPTNSIADLMYDGTNFQLLNATVSAGDTITSFNMQNLPYTEDQSAVPNIIRAEFLPTLENLNLVGANKQPGPGLAFLVKIKNTNIGIDLGSGNSPVFIEVDDWGQQYPVYANGRGVMNAYDINENDVKVFVFDGEVFWVEPDQLVRRFGSVDGWVRLDAVQGPEMDGTANTPQKAFRSIQQAYLAITSRYAPSPQLMVRIKLGESNGPGTPYFAAGVLYEGAGIGPYTGWVTIEGDINAPQNYRIGNREPIPYTYVILVHEGNLDLRGVTLVARPPNRNGILACWMNAHANVCNCNLISEVSYMDYGFITLMWGSSVFFGAPSITQSGVIQMQGNWCNMGNGIGIHASCNVWGGNYDQPSVVIGMFNTHFRGAAYTAARNSVIDTAQANPTWGWNTCTGTRWIASQFSVINTNGHILPGSAEGYVQYYGVKT